MNCSTSTAKQQELLEQILEFVSRVSGLTGVRASDGRVRILQTLDGKHIEIEASSLAGVLLRSDTESRAFIQVNFVSGLKILMTDSLIGFKPIQQTGLDAARLPRVVTTPDIISVFDAIQESLHVSDSTSSELQLLRKIYEAVLAGGEAIGFDLRTERAWFSRIPTSTLKASA